MSGSTSWIRRGLTSVVLVLVFGAALLAGALSGSAHAATVVPASGWVRPVDGAIVRAFDPPASVYGAGHRGIDVAVARGAPVRAPAAGVVAFAGAVAGHRHVVVLHDDGLRTSLSFLAEVAVRRGERVEAGQVVGAAAADGPDHGGVVHVGLRDAAGRYVDPAPLFGAVDLTEVVRLVPTHAGPLAPASPGRERRGLLAGLGALAGGVRDLATSGAEAVAGTVELTDDALVAAARAASQVVEPLGELAARGAEEAREAVARASALQPAAVAAELVFDLGRGARTWLDQRDECAADAPAADGTGGSAHRALFVSGINSAHDGDTAVDPDWPAAALGYESGEVRQYSYAATGDAYTRRDTYVPIEVAAARLGRDLRAMQREQRGREVDLLAHSQGGVVVMAFLMLHYDAADPSLPPLGTVVTLASPHRGTPAASAARFVATTPAGRAFLAALERVGVPPVGGSVDDLAEGSALVERLDATRLPEQIDLLTIGAAYDYVVPASHATRDDATAVVVNPWSPTAHSDVLRDPDALRAVRAALERRPMPCLSFLTHLVGAAAPTAITRVERVAGTVAGLAAGALP